MKTITMPVIATCHITRATDRLLQDEGDRNPWTIAAPYDEGVFIYVQSEDGEGQPAELGDIFAWARRHGHEWVCIDAAGDVVDGLPLYDWD
ncbi:hypothetical protein HDG34_003251 [Paraburkholderia sp. HC6.4b]|uniref:DUF5983 family protein n=1 Tax=unclassified Paraburkholderia TaxID=2615204 RepID=UPI0016075656|nr:MULTISPECIES: hypothetical protein [unclassified Paraburkholderia]MBB5409310.1 hypothetical protein [Paraburkholderia sp. HC6.4b]MBB5451038.1 hypothetical protein [Paraburkholderia sp. Kb1A]